MKKLFVLSFVSFLFSCSVQKDCRKTFNHNQFEVIPTDTIHIEVERYVHTYKGRFVRSSKGEWYRNCWGYDFNVGDSVVVFGEWKSLPPCPCK